MTEDLLYATKTLLGPPEQANTCYCYLSQRWLEKDVFTERTSQEMLLNILIENNELSGKEILLKFAENQNYYWRTSEKILKSYSIC